jgi:hypothetical protein
MENIRSCVILVTNEGMGKSDKALQLKLFEKYLTLLNENEMLPNAFCFYTEGVRLVTEGSPVIEELRALEKKGVRLIICSTCLEYLGLADQVQVGIVGGMPDIIEAQFKAEKVITI